MRAPMVELIANAATAQDIGARGRQEDALVTHHSDNNGPVVAVLSDGMGGHQDGDLASRIIVGTMFSEVFVASSKPSALREHCPHVLRASLNGANHQLRQHIDAGRVSSESGGTLICTTIIDGKLSWISVGDSLLYVLRDNTLQMLNEVHSMAKQLDLMVLQKKIDAETARKHPDRNCLTAAVTGGSIARIDCPDGAFDLMPSDIVLLASDGLCVLSDEEIRNVLLRNREASEQAIADALLDKVRACGVSDQDNTSIIAIKIGENEEVCEQAPATTSTFARLGRWFAGRAPRAKSGAALASR